MGPPPPVNRADKPRVTSRAPSQSPNLAPRASLTEDRISPFNSPPSSDSSPSPEPELPAPTVRPRPLTMDNGSRAKALGLSFEPPPVHHAVAEKRRDAETGLSRGTVSPQSTGHDRESKPSIPSRHMGPPPSLPQTRVSADITRVRAINNTTEPISSGRQMPPSTRVVDAANFAAPPKRIFSTPVTQQATPPRHGRSATVDHMSDRAPPEFRSPAHTIRGEHKEGLGSANYSAVTVSDSSSKSIATDYPDPRSTNRRAPRHRDGQMKIDMRYDARVFDVCGEHVCAGGVVTRVWRIGDGEQVFSAAHGEGIKILSISFKPAVSAEEEGQRIWLGNNFGELIEVDIPSHSTVGSKMQAHARHEVIKIYRHLRELWTLDDTGSLLVWPPDSTGVPNLDSRPITFRVPKGHSFSMVVDDELWHATGKDLRIFMPSSESQFQILQRPIIQDGAGEITCGAVLSGQPDRVYIGHNDGKISIYAKLDYACLGMVSVNGYKINTMVGSGDYLWAGYNTGMIYVYDTTQSPWIVKKDWRAHSNPVLSLVNDAASFWTSNRSQVVSLGADNVLQIWDGMLEEDWLGELLYDH